MALLSTGSAAVNLQRCGDIRLQVERGNVAAIGSGDFAVTLSNASSIQGVIRV